MNLKQKIRNSIRAFVIGDALGLPFEFKGKKVTLSEGMNSVSVKQ